MPCPFCGAKTHLAQPYLFALSKPRSADDAKFSRGMINFSRLLFPLPFSFSCRLLQARACSGTRLVVILSQKHGLVESNAGRACGSFLPSLRRQPHSWPILRSFNLKLIVCLAVRWPFWDETCILLLYPSTLRDPRPVWRTVQS